MWIISQKLSSITGENYIWYSKKALESRFCIGRISVASLPSTILDIMRNTCFKMNHPPESHSIQERRRELTFDGTSLKLILLGGHRILTHNIIQKDWISVCFAQAWAIKTREAVQCFEAKSEFAKAMRSEKTVNQVTTATVTTVFFFADALLWTLSAA